MFIMLHTNIDFFKMEKVTTFIEQKLVKVFFQMHVVCITSEPPPAYTWYQTAEDLSVQFTLPEGIENKDVYLSIAHNHIDFGVKNKSELLKGTLCGEVDKDASTWTVEGRR